MTIQLNFKNWIIQETISLTQAIKLYDYKPGDVIDAQDLKKRYRKLAMQYHPDRSGNEDMFNQVSDGNALLSRMVGSRIPQQMGQHWQNWQPPNPLDDIKNELTRAIAALKKNHPEDAYAAVSRLVDPNTGKLNTSQTNPLLKKGLEQWLNYYNQGFHNYLEPILVNALKMI